MQISSIYFMPFIDVVQLSSGKVSVLALKTQKRENDFLSPIVAEWQGLV